MNVLITLTTAGSDTGPFNLYSNTDSYVTAFQTNIAKSLLVAGYTSTVVPAGTSTVRVKSTGLCTTYVDLFITGSGTTTTTTTTTGGPTTTTTTTSGGGGTTTTTTTRGGGPTTTTTTTTAAVVPQWYQLTNCNTLAVNYSASYPLGSYSINERVTDFGSNVLRITQTYSSNPGGSGLFIATTGQFGCPSGTTTTTTAIPGTTTTTTTAIPGTTTTTTTAALPTIFVDFLLQLDASNTGSMDIYTASPIGAGFTLTHTLTSNAESFQAGLLAGDGYYVTVTQTTRDTAGQRGQIADTINSTTSYYYTTSGVLPKSVSSAPRTLANGNIYSVLGICGDVV